MLYIMMMMMMMIVFRECVVIHGLHLFVSVDDADGDDVRCRWAESSKHECAGVCEAFENSQLFSVSITTTGPINLSRQSKILKSPRVI